MKKETEKIKPTKCYWTETKVIQEKDEKGRLLKK